MIGGPSDVQEEVNEAWKTIQHWNDLNAESQRLMLLPMHWIKNAYPSIGKHPQKVINKQLVSQSDMMVCVFASSLESPTDDNISGSVEEIQEHVKDGKPVMVFFRTSSTTNIDVEQLCKLHEFKKNLNGLYAEFEDAKSLSTVLLDKITLSINNGVFSGYSASTEDEESERLSEEDLSNLKSWVESNDENAHMVDFIGGQSMLILGTKHIDINNSRERVSWNDFFDRLKKGEYVEIYGRTNQENPKYRLKEKAYQLFD